MKKILLVENNEYLRDVLEKTLGRIGTVTTARDVDEARIIHRSGGFDLIVSSDDINLDFAIEWLRKLRLIGRTAVLLLSAKPADQLVGLAHIPKPYELRVVVQKVRDLLEDPYSA